MKTIHSLILGIALLVSILMWGCVKVGPPEAKPPVRVYGYSAALADMFLHPVGTRWIYRHLESGTLDTVTVRDTSTAWDFYGAPSGVGNVAQARKFRVELSSTEGSGYGLSYVTATGDIGNKEIYNPIHPQHYIYQYRYFNGASCGQPYGSELIVTDFFRAGYSRNAASTAGDSYAQFTESALNANISFPDTSLKDAYEVYLTKARSESGHEVRYFFQPGRGMVRRVIYPTATGCTLEVVPGTYQLIDFYRPK